MFKLIIAESYIVSLDVWRKMLVSDCKVSERQAKDYTGVLGNPPKSQLNSSFTSEGRVSRVPRVSIRSLRPTGVAAR